MSSSDGSGPAKPFSDWLFFAIAIAIGMIAVPYAYFNYRHTEGLMRFLNIAVSLFVTGFWLFLYRAFYRNYRSMYQSRAIAPSPRIFAFYCGLQIFLALGSGISVIVAILYLTGKIPSGMGPGLFFPSADTDPFLHRK